MEDFHIKENTYYIGRMTQKKKSQKPEEKMKVFRKIRCAGGGGGPNEFCNWKGTVKLPVNQFSGAAWMESLSQGDPLENKDIEVICIGHFQDA